MITVKVRKRASPGRPRELTGDVIREFLANLRRHGNVQKAARATGYSRAGFQRLRRADPSIALAWERARLEGLEVTAMTGRSPRQRGTARMLADALRAQLDRGVKNPSLAGRRIIRSARVGRPAAAADRRPAARPAAQGGAAA